MGKVGAVVHQTRFFGTVSGNDEMHVARTGELARRLDHHVERLLRANVAGIKHDEIRAAQAKFGAEGILPREWLDLGQINPVSHQSDLVRRDPFGDKPLAHLLRDGDDA